MSPNGEKVPSVADAGVGVVAPLGKLSKPLSGIDLFANIRWDYISNFGGLADTAVGPDGHTGRVEGNKAMLSDMPVEFGATFVF